MTSYLLDTNAVSDVMQNVANVMSRVAAATSPASEVITCTIVTGEILAGIERLPAGKRRDDVQRRANLILPGLRCIGIDPAVAPHYARLKQEARLLGVAIVDNDLWIAATAIAVGATLVTRDADFSGLPGLTVEDWTR